MKQADRHRAGQQANRAGQRDQPQIMLVTEAIQNLVRTSPGSETITAMVHLN